MSKDFNVKDFETKLLALDSVSEDKALVFLSDVIDDLLIENDFDPVRKILSQIKPEQLSSLVIVGILTFGSNKNVLPQWNIFFDSGYKVLVERMGKNETDESLFGII